MSLIHNCKNKKAQYIVEPYMGGKEVSWINRFYENIDRLSYQELTNLAYETNDRRMITVLEIVGDQLKNAMEG